MSVSLVVVGNPSCRRVRFWQMAAQRLGWPLPRLASYADLLTGRTQLTDHLSTGCLLRFETAADSWETFKLLLKHGAEPARREGYPALDATQVDRLTYERGWIVRPRQAYLGFIRLLRALEAQVVGFDITPLHSTEEIALCFDKTRGQDWLARAAIPIPRLFPAASCYAELRRLVFGEGRIMVKLAHGSGAAGCMALHGSQDRIRAMTTVVQVFAGGEKRLFHSKRVQFLTHEPEIAELVDQLGVEKLHVEAWLPKARWEGKNFDLRVVTIGAIPRHIMVRSSPSVFTNLTLGNRKGSASGVAQRMGAEAWERLHDTASRVAHAFPRSFTLGLDILVRPDWRRHAVLEVNAFGDLLLGHLDRGEDTYTATLATWQRQHQRVEAALP